MAILTGPTCTSTTRSLLLTFLDISDIVLHANSGLTAYDWVIITDPDCTFLKILVRDIETFDAVLFSVSASLT